jgi:hypothetical protein
MGNRRKPTRRRFQIHAGKAEIEDRRSPISITDKGEDLIPSSQESKYTEKEEPNDNEKTENLPGPQFLVPAVNDSNFLGG